MLAFPLFRFAKEYASDYFRDAKRGVKATMEDIQKTATDFVGSGDKKEDESNAR